MGPADGGSIMGYTPPDYQGQYNALNPKTTQTGIIPGFNPNATPSNGGISWFGQGAPTVFNMNGQSNIQPYQAPKPSSNYQPASQTNFQVRSNPTAQMGTFEPAQNNTVFQMPRTPTPGMTNDAAPSNPSTFLMPGDPAATQQSTTAPPVPQGDQSPDFGLTMESLMKYMGDTHMPTMDEIQMDPSYAFQQQQGINAIDSSAAARGGLLSSGHTKDILDYSQGLASQEYGKAFDRYQGNQQFKANQLGNAWNMLNGDRTFGANRYDAGFNQNMQQNTFDQNAYQYANTTGLNQNQQNIENWFKQMGVANSNDSGLAGVGQKSAGDAVNLTTDMASALASLGMTQAQIQAMTTMGASGQNRSTIGDLISFLPMLLGAG